MSGPTTSTSPQRFFLTEHIGILVTYANGVQADLPTQVPLMLAAMNAILDSEQPGEPMRLKPDAFEVLRFPAAPSDPPAPDVTVNKQDPASVALADPFSVVFVRIADPALPDNIEPDPAQAIRLVTFLRQRTKDQAFDKLTVDQVVLNWLNSAAGPQSGIGTGGPGTRPVAYNNPANPWQQDPPPFVLDGLAEPPEAGGGVKVVVLDTAWPEDILTQARQAREQSHALVRRLLGAQGKLRGPNGRLRVRPMPQTDNDRLSLLELNTHRYAMPDHGLFSAGIINTIVPEADLVLMEVLNAHGVGDLLSLMRALSQIADPTQAPDSDDLTGDRMVINASLCMQLPFAEGQVGYEELMAWESLGVNERWLIQQSMALRRVCNLLYAQGRKLVAAAGNESLAPDRRPPARFPAALATVLGVGALPRRELNDLAASSGDPDLAAGYSNLADVQPPEGVVTLGGSGGTSAGILGLYLGDIPGPAGTIHGATANASGWAWWAGTSFATPIVTAAVALKLSAAANGPYAQRAVDALYAEPVITENFTLEGEDWLAAKQVV